MIPFFLFFVTAISTCLLTWLWGGSGATVGEQNLGYAASMVMMLAAFISAFSLWAGRCIASAALALTVVYCLCENIGMPPRLVNVRVALALLMVVAALVYVIGSFRVKGAQNVFYPRKASHFGKMVVWAFLIAPLICFVWWAFWHNATRVRAVTVPASWEPVTLDRVTSGRHQVKFTALDSSLSVTVASDGLYDELESAHKKSVDVLITKTFKHGNLVEWKVESIDGSQDFSLLEQTPDKNRDSQGWADLQVK